MNPKSFCLTFGVYIDHFPVQKGKATSEYLFKLKFY